jgi:hypothetical protein
MDRGEAGQEIPLHDPDVYPPTEESIAHLHRSGWSTGEAAFTGSSGRTVGQVDGSNGENRIHAAAPTQREAWHRAVEAAAAVGMLADWPKPTPGKGIAQIAENRSGLSLWGPGSKRCRRRHPPYFSWSRSSPGGNIRVRRRNRNRIPGPGDVAEPADQLAQLHAHRAGHLADDRERE